MSLTEFPGLVCLPLHGEILLFAIFEANHKVSSLLSLIPDSLLPADVRLDLRSAWRFLNDGSGPKMGRDAAGGGADSGLVFWVPGEEPTWGETLLMRKQANSAFLDWCSLVGVYELYMYMNIYIIFVFQLFPLCMCGGTPGGRCVCCTLCCVCVVCLSVTRIAVLCISV